MRKQIFYSMKVQTISNYALAKQFKFVLALVEDNKKAKRTKFIFVFASSLFVFVFFGA